MPKPENIVGKGFDKRPENINRSGANRKTISSVNNDLEKEGYKEASKQDITSCYLRLIQIPITELKNMAQDDSPLPSMIRIVAKSILSGKGFDVIEKILDRGIGKAVNITDITSGGERIATPTTIIFSDFKDERTKDIK